MTEKKIKEVLSNIKEPVLNIDFVKLDFVKGISLNGKNLLLKLGISDTNEVVLDDARKKITEELKRSIPEINNIEVNFITGVTEHKNEKKVRSITGNKKHYCSRFG
ncbi:MAG: DUF59 domain-containing protein [Ignavibacteria bacterium]|nr:DUF59 domain-containing protein [Ignavibacteria bacterium]